MTWGSVKTGMVTNETSFFDKQVFCGFLDPSSILCFSLSKLCLNLKKRIYSWSASNSDSRDICSSKKQELLKLWITRTLPKTKTKSALRCLHNTGLQLFFHKDLLLNIDVQDKTRVGDERNMELFLCLTLVRKKNYTIDEKYLYIHYIFDKTHNHFLNFDSIRTC